jgi:hypothetical protein
MVALAGVFCVTSTASAQLLCSKTSGSGKVKYKIRQTCKSSETEVGTLATTADVDAVPRTVVYDHSNGGAQAFNGSNQVVDLDGNGADHFAYTSTKVSTIVVVFSAECNALGGGVGNIDIRLNGVALGGSGADNDQFCNGEVHTVSRTVTAAAVPPGSQTIDVRANGTFSLDDTDLVIIAVEGVFP